MMTLSEVMPLGDSEAVGPMVITSLFLISAHDVAQSHVSGCVAVRMFDTGAVKRQRH